MFHRSFACGLALAFLCTAGTAIAGDGTKPSPPVAPAAKDRADEVFRQGLAAYDAGRLEQAERLFRDAFDIKKTHDIAGNLGVVEMLRGKHRDAAEHIAWALQHMPPTESSKMRKGLEGELQKARIQVGSLRVRVSLDGRNAGAEVFIDGRSVGMAPLADEVFVDAGAHVVEARADGYVAARSSVDVAKGGTEQVMLQLRRSEAGSPQRWKPGLSLLIPAGVLAVGGLATGFGLTLAANGKRNDADEIRAKLTSAGATCQGSPAGTAASSCQALRQAAESRDSLSKGAVSGFVIGGAFALVTTGLGVWAGMSPKSARTGRHLRALPIVGANEGGLMVAGEW